MEHRARPGDADGRGAGQGLPGSGGGLQRRLHLFERVEAGLGERVGLEDEVEPGDVVAVGGGGGLGADVPRLGRHADGLADESIEEAAVGSVAGGLPSGWVSERTSAMLSIESSLRRQLGDCLAPFRRAEVDEGWWTSARRRAQFTDGEIPPDGVRADHAGRIRVQIAQLAVVGFGQGTDHRQGEEHEQADRENRQRMGDDQVGDPSPESMAGR